MRQRGEPKFWLAPRFICYSFESCCHGRRFISLHRWPCLPLHGGHVAFEQFNARWPLPHVAGSPDRGVLSASLTAVGPSDRSRLFGLAGPTSLRLSPTALPCSHGTFGQHAGGTNPGSISRRSPWRVVKFCLPPSGIRSATSTTIDFGAMSVHFRSGLLSPCLRFAEPVTGHHARLGSRLPAKLYRGRHFRRHGFMRFQGATRTDPGVRLSRTGLLSKVERDRSAEA